MTQIHTESSDPAPIDDRAFKLQSCNLEAKVVGVEVEGSDVSSEVTSLIHHLELNKSGWWDRALERLVVVVSWLEGPLTADALATKLLTVVGDGVQRDRIDGFIAKAVATGDLFESTTGLIKPSERVAAALASDKASSDESDERLWLRFIGMVGDAGLDADPVDIWSDFKNMFLWPLVRESGARVYEVVAAGAPIDSNVLSYEALVGPLCEKYGPELRDLLVEFLDPGDTDVRSLILRMLNGAFAREAAGLTPAVLSRLASSSGRPDRVRIFLDSNFLLSFLKLHDNPGNETADDLIRVLEQARANLAIELYILPITVDEVRRVLQSVISRLDGLLPFRNMAQAAMNLRSHGLVSAYLEAASRTTGRLRPQDFFGPYESDLVPILNERGVKLYNADLADLRVDQKVIDDIHALQDRQQARPGGPKSYEANLHDAVLWRFTARKRPVGVDSPLELGYWVCTLDFALMRFDRSKGRKDNRPPVCLSPSSLIHLLQFWAPRSEDFDRALVGSIREPLLYLDFDNDTERTTIDILRSMSRFENISDLAPKTVLGILRNDALRTRLEATPPPTPEEQLELVELAIIEETALLDAELASAKAALATEAAEADRRAADADAAQAELRRKADEAEERASAAAQTIDELQQALVDQEVEARSAKEHQKQELSSLSDRLRQVEEDASRSKAVRRVIGLSSLLAVVLGLLVFVAGRLLTGHVSTWFAWTAPTMIAIGIEALGVSELLKRAHPSLDRCAKGLRNYVGGYFVLIVLGLGVSIVGNKMTTALDAPQHRDAPSTPSTSRP